MSTVAFEGETMVVQFDKFGLQEYDLFLRTKRIPEALISKASLLGYGMNFQHCTSIVFSGWNDSYEQWYQAILRTYRYGQLRQLKVHVPYIPELEGHILENVLRKQTQFEQDTEQQEQLYINAFKQTRPCN